MFDTVRELGIGFVDYSPLGRGFLSGAISLTTDDLSRIDRAAPQGAVSGDRYADMSGVHI